MIVPPIPHILGGLCCSTPLTNGNEPERSPFIMRGMTKRELVKYMYKERNATLIPV